MKAIIKEITLRKSYLGDASLSSIYFGGGTPSLLSNDELESIMAAIKSQFEVEVGAEITLEANPDDLTVEKLQMLQQSDINRLSIGIQSFREEDLSFMNRAHSADQALAVVDDAMRMGFRDLSVDLIYGIPGLSMEAWSENMERVFASGVDHLSCYALTVESGTALAYKISKGRIAPLSDKLAEEQFLMLVDKTAINGFEHYEISNFARPGHYARHNTNYWKGVPYLGIGPSAHSYDGKSRAWNVANNPKYIKALKEDILPITVEELSDTDRYNEYIMTGMRTVWGCSLDEIEDFGSAYLHDFSAGIETFVRDGLVIKQAGRYTLSTDGKLFADRIASDLFCSD